MRTFLKVTMSFDVVGATIGRSHRRNKIACNAMDYLPKEIVKEEHKFQSCT